LPESNYKKLLKYHSKSRNISEIVKSNNYISLPINIEHSNTLELSDSILQISDNGLYYSNYKLFKSSGNEGKKYRVTLYGLCDCFGFRKYILNPTLVIVDNENKIIETKLVKNETIMLPNQYSNTLPFHTDNEWEYIIPKSGVYKIIVFSNNKIVGSEFPSQALINWPVFRTNIKGDFMITIQEK
jgi:hypothetical protein